MMAAICWYRAPPRPAPAPWHNILVTIWWIGFRYNNIHHRYMQNSWTGMVNIFMCCDEQCWGRSSPGGSPHYPPSSSRQTGTDREFIPSQQRDTHLLPLSKHCNHQLLHTGCWLLAPALAAAQFILHHIFQFDVNSQFIPARSLVWCGCRARDTAPCTTRN